MKTFTKLHLIFAIVGLFSLSACKQSTEPTSSGTEAATDNSFAESAFNDVVTISDQAGDDGYLATYRTDQPAGTILAGCATVTINKTVNPHQIIVDFGTVNCLCKDGKNRRGKILISYTGKYRDSASTHTISFENYFVNGFKVDGTKTVTNGGHNSDGHLVYSITVQGMITDTTGRTLTWNSTRTRKWLEGESTKGLLGWIDDVYSISGSTTGKSFNGTTYSASVTVPLLVALNCKWIKQGKFTFTPGTEEPRYFDFGNGDCDALASVTLDGKTYPFLMR